MKSISQRFIAMTLATSILLPVTASATNGYFLIGFGPKSRAMGGAGVALGDDDGMAAAANPAALVNAGSRMDINGELFAPPRAAFNYSKTLATDVKSGSNLFLIPSMGGAYQFNRKLAVGFAMIGAGMGTRYNQTCGTGPGASWFPPGGPDGNFFNYNCKNGGVGANNTVGVSLMQAQMLPSVAYKLSNTQSIGGSLAIGMQTFRAEGLQAFGGPPFNFSSGNNFTDRGNDWSAGAGIRLGWLGKFADDRFRFGVNYSSRVFMSKFRKYRDLFAQQGSFDIPENFAFGLAIKPSDQLTVAFDVQRNLFKSVRSVGNPGPTTDSVNIFPDGYGKTGQDNGLGFGWKDQTVYKLGVAYKYSDHWTWRAGLNYGKSPVQSDQILFNLLAPGIVEKHVTFGASYAYSDHVEFNFNYMHAFKNTLRGKTIFSANPGGDNAAVSMYQNSLGFGLGYKF